MTAARNLRIKNENHDLIVEFETQLQRIILGKREEIRQCLCSVLAGGHVLIEDVPGVGKTTLVKAFARLLNLKMNRVQFTNDMLPGDILGSSIFDAQDGAFTFHKGPIFAQLILADEINRATPKTQSACLQAMEEGQVTVDGVTYELPKPFFVIATQNPGQNIGTFALPESQLDRFMMKIHLGFPNREAERELLLSENRQTMMLDVKPVLNPELVLQIQKDVAQVHVSEAIVEYLQDIIDASRRKFQGLSPRAAIGILKAARAWAYIEGRNFVVPDDLQAIAVVTMNHRLSSQEDPFGLNGVQRAKEIIESVPVR